MKRILFLSDMHVGSIAGITAPEHMVHPKASSVLRALQEEIWDAWRDIVYNFRKPDKLVLVGDIVDGNGAKNGGVEQSTTDRIEQADRAVNILKMLNPREVYCVAGTPFHVGTSEDYERIIAERLEAKFCGHLQLDIDDKLYDIKHHVGGGALPHSKASQITKEGLFNLLLNDAGMAERADVIVRGHVHTYTHVRQFTNSGIRVCITLPGLQAPIAGKYGRSCPSYVHWGALGAEQNSKGEISWDESRIQSLATAKIPVFKA